MMRDEFHYLSIAFRFCDIHSVLFLSFVRLRSLPLPYVSSFRYKPGNQYRMGTT